MIKTTILYISHKPVPTINNPIYLPLEVGATTHKNYFFAKQDNNGINISEKNPYFCELTGLYWAFKNLDYDVLGLVHYRRLFMKSSFCLRKKRENVISDQCIQKILTKYDLILPKKRHYVIESNYSHYIHAHNKEALDITGQIIKKNYPDYFPAFEKHMKQTTGHYFNMFIGKKEIVNPLLSWLFDILFTLENQIDLTKYTDAEKRVFGYVSELLFDVYIQTNHLKIKNQRYLFFERQNWPQKILSFVKRKIHNNEK